MKSKNYVLMQMKQLLMDRKEYSEAKATAWVEAHREKTVYELLVLKKDLTTVEEECRDVSWRTSTWCEDDD